MTEAEDTEPLPRVTLPEEASPEKSETQDDEVLGVSTGRTCLTQPAVSGAGFPGADHPGDGMRPGGSKPKKQKCAGG